MFKLFRISNKTTKILAISSLAILIIPGENDSVGSMSKSVKALFNYYKKLKIENVELKIYPNARHEILNEPKIKNEVYQDVINFISK